MRGLNGWAEQMIVNYQLPPLKDDEYYVQWETGRLGVNITEDKESELPIVWNIIDPSSPLASSMEVGDYLLCVNELRAQDNTFHNFLQLLTTKQKPVLLRFRRARMKEVLPRSKSLKEMKANSFKLSNDGGFFRSRSTSKSRKTFVEDSRHSEAKKTSPRDLLAMDPYRKYRYEYTWNEGSLGLYFGEEESLAMPVITRTLAHASPELLANVAPNDILVSANGLMSYDVTFSEFFSQLQHWNKPIYLVFQTARPPCPSTPKDAPPMSPIELNNVPSPQEPVAIRDSIRESTKSKLSFGLSPKLAIREVPKPSSSPPNAIQPKLPTSPPNGAKISSSPPYGAKLSTTQPNGAKLSSSPPNGGVHPRLVQTPPNGHQESPPSEMERSKTPPLPATSPEAIKPISLSPNPPPTKSKSPPVAAPVTPPLALSPERESPIPSTETSPPPPTVATPVVTVFEDSDSDEEEQRKQYEQQSEYIDDEDELLSTEDEDIDAVADLEPEQVKEEPTVKHEAIFSKPEDEDIPESDSLPVASSDDEPDTDGDLDIDLEEEPNEDSENEAMPKLDYPVQILTNEAQRATIVPKPVPSRGGGERTGKIKGRGKNKRSSGSALTRLPRITESDEQTIPLLEPNSVNMKLNVRGKLKSQRVSKMDTPDSSLYLLKWKENRSIGLQLREVRLNKGVYPMVVLVCREPCCEALRHVNVGDLLLEINGRDTAMMGVKKTINFVKTCTKTALLKLKRVIMSTRLFVQNLPLYVDDDKLRKHFAANGEVTDAVVVKTKEGKSRRFGFVGFKSEAQTIAAQKFFDKTFFDTTRITVKIAQPRESTELERPWSKYSKGSSRHVEKTSQENEVVGENDKKEDAGSEKKASGEDSAFDEFVETMQPRSQTKFWANDDVTTHEVKVDTNDESDDEYQDLDKIHEEKSDEEEENEEDMDKSTATKKTMSDLDFLKSKMVQTIKSDDEVEEENEDDEEDLSEKEDNDDEEKPEESNTKAVKETETVAPSSRLFVRNLPYSTVEEDLHELFAGYGTITEVHMPLDDTKRTKGFGFIMFKSTAEATAAREALDGKPFQGRLLHILPAKGKLEPEALDTSTLTYKQKKEIERKQLANNKVGWNASYIRGDATVDALASRLNVKKGEILDKDAGNMAVRLAIGETMLLQENQAFFEQEGVDLSVIEGSTAKSKKATERSTTVLLIKNLPFSTDEVALAQLFRTHGELTRFILPPSKTMALIEFVEASEARKAFRSLAYKKFQNVPLYLEWAPVKVFKGPPKMTYSEKVKSQALSLPARPEVEAENVAELDNTLCVKNLNFSTTEKTLQALFEKMGTVRKATIARKKDPKTQKPTLSMGFGFVEFNTAAAAKKAMTQLQGNLLDGHAIDIKLSKKQLAPVKKASQSKKPSTKVICRNIAFEATIKDIRELFGAFGQLKTVRMPKKFDGKHRGFAFIEFLTEAEAKSAFASLASSHLYGRHLVLEWAEDADDIDTLRAKASRDLASIEDGQRAAKKLKSKEVEDDMDF
ncbi:RNA-binding protein [Thraustotheca clavata]|uniref:RNA-binding protein n=1 Tax=Thraustotheca clavata TaxID=74557 RepID=A0A1W0A677_9STRA|nr:RNA-binding protein [Thraustotheca clavata]